MLIRTLTQQNTTNSLRKNDKRQQPTTNETEIRKQTRDIELPEQPFVK